MASPPTELPPPGMGHMGHMARPFRVRGESYTDLSELAANASRQDAVISLLRTPYTLEALVRERDDLEMRVMRKAEHAAEWQSRGEWAEELLWQLYEGIYGHRNAEGIDPFKTAVGKAAMASTTSIPVTTVPKTA